MRLKYQLFLTLLAASAVLIALMYVISSWSFSRGFLEYVKQNEKDRWQAVSEQLIERHNEEGDWVWANRRSLRSINGFTHYQRKPSDAEQTGRNRHGRRPLIIADADKQIIVGNIRPDRPIQWLPLKNDESVIGYLVVPTVESIDRRFDQIFERKQKKALGLTALVMIVISGLLSIPLAGRIVRPLLTVNHAVGEISRGSYEHQININRRDEIGDLANNINLLGTKLKQNRDARQRWIAEISHELRTPLAVLRGEIEAVQDGVRTLDKQAVESLHGEVLSLGRLIDDLHTLSVSDVGALDYRFEALNPNNILGDFLDSHRDVIEDKSLSLTRSFDANTTMSLMQADSQRMEQLFSNLLQNTCRYTDTGGQLHVELQILKSESAIAASQNAIVINWYDSSPGVEVEALPKLFDPLYRTEISRNREYGGTGLGLAIAKRIVEAHQGYITASESSLGGLHITIELPVTRTARST